MDEKNLDNLQMVLEEKFPFGIPRKDIGEATGFVLHPRTMANADCMRKGIPGKFRIGGKIIYPVKGVISFIKNRMDRTI